ncbi:DinB family protein [Gordonia liuliyuniae]|uniref:Methyltransferase type 12 n=1 Tax=Gordonia liuliyuniae TaxID=2911517 RepID=A0ABS9IY57_9ACTN|nr:DinB family protein [Gordonia liuliyuniae]MCF8590496.1 methyltransferase type 12 [Gordonia liuliyuniae]
MPITPDDKDWTWVTTRRCGFCGFDPGGVHRTQIADRIAESADGWREVLARADADHRRNDHTWSPLEYGCHVRDVHTVMRERLELMLTVTPATFANWDQDEAAVDGRYGEQDPGVVADRLEANAAAFATAYRAVADDEWEREGLRGNGAAFTVWSLAAYALHDLEHHRVDVGLPATPEHAE